MGDRLVVAKRMSGIGDMLLQAMHVLWYARLSGRTAYIDWRRSLYSALNDERNLFPRLFEEPRNDTAEGKLARCRDFWPASWNRSNIHGSFTILNGPGSTRSALDGEPAFLFDFLCGEPDRTESCVVVTRYCHFLPKLVCHRLAQEFVPVKRLRDAVAARRAAYGAPGPLIGVHFRDFHALCPAGGRAEKLALYRSALESMVRQHPGAGIAIFSDNPEAAAELAQGYESRLVKLSSPDAKPQSFHRYSMGLDATHPDLPAEADKVIEEIWLLSSCDVLLGSNASAFYLFASYKSAAFAAGRCIILDTKALDREARLPFEEKIALAVSTR
jgi:hypothetical protein